MKKLLLNVSYTDNTKKYWNDSYIKNMVVFWDEKISLNDFIASVLLDNDYTTMLYKNKPQANIYIDDKEGNAKAIGYIYRVKTEEIEGKQATFDAWISISEVIDFPIIELN